MSFHYVRGNPPLNFFAALRAGAGSLKARLPKLEDMVSCRNCARGRSPVHSSRGCDKRDAVKKSAARNGSNQLDYETQVAYSAVPMPLILANTRSVKRTGSGLVYL